MSKRKYILLEMSFWEEFSKRYSSFHLSLDKKTIDELETWFDLWLFISRSHLVFYCTEEGFEKATYSDPLLSMLWKKKASGECEIVFKQELSCSIEEDIIQYPTAILLSHNDKSELASLYGIINVNANNYPSKHYLFRDSGPAIKRGQQWGWEAIRDYVAESSNSMIIVDNYVFREADNNLFELIRILLPQKISIKYHLTLFSPQTSTYNETKLNDFIEKEMPHLKDNIDIKCHTTNSSDFHDRAIITNNIWIGCEGGFDLLDRNKKSTKSTKIHIVFPYIASNNIKWSDKAYEDLLSDANKVLKNRQIQSNNRLIV